MAPTDLIDHVHAEDRSTSGPQLLTATSMAASQEFDPRGEQESWPGSSSWPWVLRQMAPSKGRGWHMLDLVTSGSVGHLFPWMCRWLHQGGHVKLLPWKGVASLDGVYTCPMLSESEVCEMGVMCFESRLAFLDSKGLHHWNELEEDETTSEE